MKFPAEKDLKPGDLAFATYVDAGLKTWLHLAAAVRDAYRDQVGEVPDLVLIAVPAGRGKPLAEGLQESFIQDPT